MYTYALLALVPLVLGCANPDTDSCASFMSAQSATAGPYCATFTQGTVTATAGLPAWATSYCKGKPKTVSKECSCWYTGGVTATTTAATTPAGVTTTPGTTLSTSTTSAGPAQSGTCGSPNYGLVGYAAGTTGGGSGSGTTVTSCSGLSSAASAGGVIKISGLLSGCGIVDLVSSTSVIGVGSGSGLTNGGLRIKGATNVILRNLKLHIPPAGKDLVELQESTKVWVDHCSFSSAGITGDKDTYDGLLDITHGSDLVTVSWNKFSDHWKGSLVGHSDSNSAEDSGHLKVTYHHNWFTNVNSRLPSLRFGTGHIFSSCFENCPTSGINSRMGAQVLVEQNYFNNVPLAIVTDLDSDSDGYAVNRNNVFAGTSTTRITQVGSLTPPYTYTTDAASCVCGTVKSYAGVGIVS